MLWNKLTICRLNCFLYFKQLTTLFAYAYLPVFWCYYKGGGRGFRIYAMWLTFLFNFTHWILGTSILQLVKNQTFFFSLKNIYFLLLIYVYVYVWRPEEGIRFPGAEVTGCWLWFTWHGYWELNSEPLSEQHVLLTAVPFSSPPPPARIKYSSWLSVLVFTRYVRLASNT